MLEKKKTKRGGRVRGHKKFGYKMVGVLKVLSLCSTGLCVSFFFKKKERFL